MPHKGAIEPGFVEELLSLRTRGQRERLLRDAGLLNADGLDLLLDAADTLLDADPGKARRLAELCAGLANGAGAPAVVPRASYIRAGAHSLNGEFDEDLRLTETARAGYAALGMDLEALRTNVGKMAVLLELGRYEEALEAGVAVLDTVEGGDGIEPRPTREQYYSLAAPVHLNRGGCYEYMGRYDEALDSYTAAEECYRALGMTERIGQVLDNRSAVLLHLGQGSEALAVREFAASTFREAGLTVLFAKALANIGYTHLHLGNYVRSLGTFEQARRLVESLDAHVDRALLLRDTANAYLELNLYSEAVATYQEANLLLANSGMVHDRAEVLWGMGSALIARSELEAAEEALAEAAVLFEGAGNAPRLSGVMLEQASLRKLHGDGEEALAMARRALDLVSCEKRPVQQVYARLYLADLLLPDTAGAERNLEKALKLADPLGLPQLRYRLHERLGHIRVLQGREGEARALLEEAVEEIERLRGTVAQEPIRASFLRDKTAAYEGLLLLHLMRDDEESVRRAFAIAEQAKSRALVDLLTGVADKKPVRAADTDLERRIGTLQADLNAVYSELLGGRSDEERPAPLPGLHARAVELEQEISRLRLRFAVVGHDPDPFAASVSSEDVQDRLPSETVLLAYHVAGDEILAFVYACGRVRVARHLGTVGEVERLLRKLDVQWERFRAGQKFAERHMAMLERSARQVLAALYGELVAPLEPLLEEAVSISGGTGPVPKLAVVPHGPLHRVPFHALFDGGRYLIERFDVSYAPSATVYALCQDREPLDRNGAAVFGVEDALIPAATTEARAVAQRLPGARARVGESVTVEALRAEASGSGILHLACHGLFRSDNPMFSALKLHDGWLMAADAMSLDLSGALVTLSACESGRGEVIGGDEVLGLTRAFLGAGAATLVVSLWLVQDETTADLMGDWYGRLRDGQGRSAALRIAQLELKERHPHPYYWAPFVLLGKR